MASLRLILSFTGFLTLICLAVLPAATALAEDPLPCFAPKLDHCGNNGHETDCQTILLVSCKGYTQTVCPTKSVNQIYVGPFTADKNQNPNTHHRPAFDPKTGQSISKLCSIRNMCKWSSMGNYCDLIGPVKQIECFAPIYEPTDCK
jgi:hypothetical protein